MYAIWFESDYKDTILLVDTSESIKNRAEKFRIDWVDLIKKEGVAIK